MVRILASDISRLFKYSKRGRPLGKHGSCLTDTWSCLPIRTGDLPLGPNTTRGISQDEEQLILLPDAVMHLTVKGVPLHRTENTGFCNTRKITVFVGFQTSSHLSVPSPSGDEKVGGKIEEPKSRADERVLGTQKTKHLEQHHNHCGNFEL